MFVVYPYSPPQPDMMDWSVHYPYYFAPHGTEAEAEAQKMGKAVEFADIGCGYGGLLGMCLAFAQHTLLPI